MIDDPINGAAHSADESPPPDPPFGTFRFDRQSQRMTWSESVYSICGYVPGTVDASLELVVAHLHPADRTRWQEAFARLLAVGDDFCQAIRLVDTRRSAHTAVCAATAEFDRSGRVSQVSGVLIDLTETLRRSTNADVSRAVERSAASRSRIEQAKGLVMASFDLSDEQAFDLLRLYSSRGKTKVRDIAATLVEGLDHPDLAATPPWQRVATLLSDLGDERTPGLPAQRAIGSVTDTAGTERGGVTLSTMSLIPPADLPRTLSWAIAGAAQSITIADALKPDRPLVYVNAAFVDLTGYPAAEILGRNCRFLQGPDTEPAQIAEMHAALTEGRELRTVLRNYRRDDTPFWNEVHLSGVRDDTGRLTHFIGYQTDVSERVERERQLFQLAYFDVLTGLPNQARALLHLGSVIASTGSAELLHIQVIGLRFAEESGNEGIADTVLVTAGRRLRAMVRQDDLVAKLDGNAFLVVHRDGGMQDAMAAARAIVDEPIVTSAGDLRISVRVGSASCPRDSRYPSELIAIAAAGAVRVS